MFKWAEIALKANKVRYNELSALMNECQFANSVEFIEINKDDLQIQIAEANKKYDGLRIGRGLGEVVLPYFVHHSMVTAKVKVADALVKRGKDSWLESNMSEGFCLELRKMGASLDLESSALIVGSGAAARAAITSLFMVGFKKFSISDLDEDHAKTLAVSMRNSHLGAEFSIVPKDGLILLPGTHGVMVNTTPLEADNKILEELYYFNFFIQGGVAVDFTVEPIETPLMKAALDVGAKCIYGYQISAATDLIWAEQIMGKKIKNSHSYAARLKEKLSQSA